LSESEFWDEITPGMFFALLDRWMSEQRARASQLAMLNWMYHKTHFNSDRNLTPEDFMTFRDRVDSENENKTSELMAAFLSKKLKAQLKYATRQ